MNKDTQHINHCVTTIYDNFKSYAETRTLREVAELVKPDWEIKRLSDTMLRVTTEIEGVEYTVRVNKTHLTTTVSVSVWELDEEE